MSGLLYAILCTLLDVDEVPESSAVMIFKQLAISAWNTKYYDILEHECYHSCYAGNKSLFLQGPLLTNPGLLPFMQHRLTVTTLTFFGGELGTSPLDVLP